MKQIVNTKKLLKATIALSAFVLVGCVGVASDNYYRAYNQPVENDYTPAEIFIEDEILVEEEMPCEEVVAEEKVTTETVVEKKKTTRSVASSSPAKAHVVPTKPVDKCIESQTVDCPFAKEKAKKEVEVKQKPQVAPTPVKEVVKTPAPAPVVALAPLPQAKPIIKDELIENTKPAKKEPTPPVVETVIEDNSAEEKAKDIAIIDDIISEETAVVIELPDNMAELEAKEEARLKAEEEARLKAEQEAKQNAEEEARLKAEQEAKQKAEEEARLKAEEEARLKAEQDARLAEQKAAQEAERLRLQKEMEALEAQKKALEEEKIKITQIQHTAPESCEDVKDWVAAEGTTLRSLLLEWGDRVGWRIVWNMDRDYALEAGAVFRGRFVDVAAALLRSFARATPAPKGVFYKGNKVLVISTREDENAD